MADSRLESRCPVEDRGWRRWQQARIYHSAHLETLTWLSDDGGCGRFIGQPVTRVVPHQKQWCAHTRMIVSRKTTQNNAKNIYSIHRLPNTCGRPLGFQAYLRFLWKKRHPFPQWLMKRKKRMNSAGDWQLAWSSALLSREIISKVDNVHATLCKISNLSDLNLLAKRQDFESSDLTTCSRSEKITWEIIEIV